MDTKQDGNVLVCFNDDGVCNIKLVGNVRYDSTSKGFMDFVNTKLLDEAVTDVVVDIRECEYIDSTDIGILASIAMTQKEKSAPKPTIIYSETKEESSVMRAISDVNVSVLFDLLESEEISAACKFNKLEAKDCSQHEYSKIMYKTHKILSDLDESNKKKFESVMKYLTESVSTSSRKK